VERRFWGPICQVPHGLFFHRRDGSEVMMALNAADGKFAWQTIYAAPDNLADSCLWTKPHRIVKSIA
jgi:hypothetical protein